MLEEHATIEDTIPLTKCNSLGAMSPKTNLAMRGKQSPYTKKLLFILLGAMSVLLYFMFHTTGQSIAGEENIFLDKDRSNAYNVRILPASLSDSELHELPSNSFSYLAMIDAGSSGCRAHIYRYGKLGTISGPLYILPNHVSKKVKPGLSSFASHASDAGESLQGLVDFMKVNVPESEWATTPIWLKATAGLRMVTETERNDILGSVSSFLGNRAKSPFLFRKSWAKVIPGSEEGGFGWIAYNYLKKIIGPKKTGKEDPYAVVEMGGASLQVSQVAQTEKDIAQIPDKYLFQFDIEGESFTLYTYSYLGYGGEQARENLNKYYLESNSHRLKDKNGIKDTCLNPGFIRPATEERQEPYQGPAGSYNVHGSSTDKGSTCETAMQSLFTPSTEMKSNENCEDDGPYSFKCVYQPDFVKASKNFLVFENFFYIASAIGVKQASDIQSNEKAAFPLVTTPKNFKTASEQVCAKSWSELESDYPLDKSCEKCNQKWCFGATYASLFLTNGIGMDENKKITIQKEVDGSEIEWALGAAYKEASDFLKRTNLRPT